MWPPAYSCGERTSMTVTSPAAIAAMNVAASMWAPISMVPDPPPIMDPPAPLVDAPPPPSDVVVPPHPDRTSARVRAPPARAVAVRLVRVFMVASGGYRIPLGVSGPAEGARDPARWGPSLTSMLWSHGHPGSGSGRSAHRHRHSPRGRVRRTRRGQPGQRGDRACPAGPHHHPRHAVRRG